MKNWNVVENELMKGNVVSIDNLMYSGEIGVVGEYVYLLCEGNNSKCKKENLKKYIEYLGNDEWLNKNIFNDDSEVEVLDESNRENFEFYVYVNNEVDDKKIIDDDFDENDIGWYEEEYEGFEEIEF